MEHPQQRLGKVNTKQPLQLRTERDGGPRQKRQGIQREPPTTTPVGKAPGLLHANHPGAGRTGGSNHLVTRAEMMSVMVALTSASISSTGPGMGSCWQRCSALRICCRFCQMISANFSHLHGSPRTPGGQWYHPTPQAPVWGECPKTQLLPHPGRYCTSAATPDPGAECPRFQEHRAARDQHPGTGPLCLRLTLHTQPCPPPQHRDSLPGHMAHDGGPKVALGTPSELSLAAAQRELAA